MIQSRALGSYLGLAVGDALGATVEFMTPSDISARYGVHKDIIGGGWLHLKPGQVTDDTEMSLALGSSILSTGQVNPVDVLDRFVAWFRAGPIDVGGTCARGIRRYMSTGHMVMPTDPMAAGNGAVMRTLPVVLASYRNPKLMREWALAQARTTHNNTLSNAAVLFTVDIVRALLLGHETGPVIDSFLERFPIFRFDPFPGRSSAYIVHTMQTVLDAFQNTNSFEACLVRAVNRGGDADTTGAIVGMLAGARYGVEAIPKGWLQTLDREVRDEATRQAKHLMEINV